MTSRRLSSVKSRDRRLFSPIRSSIWASTFSSLVMAVVIITRLAAYNTSSNASSRPVSFAYTRRVRRACEALTKRPFWSFR
jgi:hypothetical protein